jgi:hypothetical protein
MDRRVVFRMIPSLRVTAFPSRLSNEPMLACAACEGGSLRVLASPDISGVFDTRSGHTRSGHA